MSTTLRAELSEKNEYWISRHRYYELKHFCLQYPEWKRAYTMLSGLQRRGNMETERVQTSAIGDPTERCVEEREIYSRRMSTVEEAAAAADKALQIYILRGVTEGRAYDNLKMVMDIPCCKDTYYDRYRKFFWILDKYRA